MNKRMFMTFLRWLGKKVASKHLDTPEVFFKEAMTWEYKKVDEWQLQRCLALYYEKGVVPSFVEKTMRFLYSCFTV